MTTQYLEEDLQLIQRYFPGARAVKLRTPFDLTEFGDPWRLRSDDCDELCAVRWYGGVQWES